MSYSDKAAYEWAMREIAKLEAKIKELEEQIKQLTNKPA